MKQLSYKYKIYILLASVIIVAVVFFLFLYPWVSGKNQLVADTASVKSQELAEVKAEQQSYDFGKRDLDALVTKPVQPDDLFSQDTKVVKEIKTLETLAQSLGIRFILQVSGTIKTAPKVTKATGQLFTVPYTVTLEGPFDKVVNYIETTEHLNFVTSTRTLNVVAVSNTIVRATLSSEFYIKP